MNRIDELLSGALRVATWYDRAPLAFVFVMAFVLSAAVRSQRVEPVSRERGQALGFAVLVIYLVYRYFHGDFEYPAETLGAVLRAWMGGSLVASTFVLLAAAWMSVARTRRSGGRAVRRVGRWGAWLWKWL